jgi:hypothetical protein
MPESIENRNLKPGKTDEITEGINHPLPDLTYLKEMAGGDEDFVKEIINHFLENGPRLINLMRESALSGDDEKLHFAAHKLLPQLTFVGILTAIPDIEKIENDYKLMGDLSVVIERAIKTINFGIEDLKKMI